MLSVRSIKEEKKMRSKSKSSEMITSMVLKTCMNGAKGTKIVTKPGPSSLKLISYLLLIDDGLIEVRSYGPRSVHKTTKKGMEAIERFDGFQEGREKIHA